MTVVYGFALDPESGDPLAGCEVTAMIYPRSASVPPITGGTDRFVTGVDGRWELNLPPTSASGVTFRIREWLNRIYYVDVPGTGGPYEVTTIDVDPGSEGPIVPTPSLYLTRAERGAPSGVASLDSSGKVPVAQLIGVDQILITRVAAATLSGHRVVTVNGSNQLVYASNATVGHVNAALWLTLGAITSGATASVLAFGPVEEPSWNWTAGPIYLAATGLLTQTPPVNPALFLAQVGYAVSATRVVFDRQPSIFLI